EGSRDRIAGEEEALVELPQGWISRQHGAEGRMLVGRQHLVGFQIGVQHDEDLVSWNGLLRGVAHASLPGLEAVARATGSRGGPSRRACNSRRALASRLITVPMGVPVMSAASL